jgi:hypothetical protein
MQAVLFIRHLGHPRTSSETIKGIKISIHTDDYKMAGDVLPAFFFTRDKFIGYPGLL